MILRHFVVVEVVIFLVFRLISIQDHWKCSISLLQGTMVRPRPGLNFPFEHMDSLWRRCLVERRPQTTVLRRRGLRPLPTSTCYHCPIPPKRSAEGRQAYRAQRVTNTPSLLMILLMRSLFAKHLQQRARDLRFHSAATTLISTRRVCPAAR